MFYKCAIACLVTINAPHSKIYADDSYDAKGNLKKGAKVIGANAGKSYDLKPAGEAVEIPDDVCKIPAVQDQIKTHLASGSIKKVTIENGATNYDAMGREELESTATMFGIKFDDNMNNDELIQAIEAKSAG